MAPVFFPIRNTNSDRGQGVVLFMYGNTISNSAVGVEVHSDAVDPQGAVMINKDGETAYYSGRDLAGLMKLAHDKTSGFQMSDFKLLGRIDTDHAVSVAYSYHYQATTDGITLKATLEADETYEKTDGSWKLFSGAYWQTTER